eukprot:706214-Rhodomonas_salina.4
MQADFEGDCTHPSSPIPPHNPSRLLSFLDCESDVIEFNAKFVNPDAGWRGCVDANSARDGCDGWVCLRSRCNIVTRVAG